MTSLIADLLNRLDTERRYEFEERAGTIEFDSGVTRDEAEALALIDLLRTHPGALVGVTVHEVHRNGSQEFVITTDVNAARDHFDSVGVPLVRIVDLSELIRSDFDGMALIGRFK